MKTTMAPHTSIVDSSSGNNIMKSDRRASKPLMEKRRRERINKSLNELKIILLDALRKDSTCHSKLEKADILEMTVRYLRSIQRHRITTAMALDPSVFNKYRAGYVECKSEVTNFFSNSAENLLPEVKSRLMTHLGNNIMCSPHTQMMATAQPPPTEAAMQRMSIQLSPMHVIPTSIGGGDRKHECMAATCQGLTPKHSHMEIKQHSLPILSPSPSPIHGHTSGSSVGNCSPDYSSSPSLSPASLQYQKCYPVLPPLIQQEHQRMQGGLFVIPKPAQYVNSPPSDQQASSPNGRRSMPDSPTSFQRNSPRLYDDTALPPSPRSVTSANQQESTKAFQPFFKFPMKMEPASPASSSSGCDPVWRPW